MNRLVLDHHLILFRHKLTAAEIALYEQMFAHYDQDRSGSIDTHELKALLSELGCKVCYWI